MTAPVKRAPQSPASCARASRSVFRAAFLARQVSLAGVALEPATPLRRRLLDDYRATCEALRARTEAAAQARRAAWVAPSQCDLFAWAEARRAAPRLPKPAARTRLSLTTGGVVRGGPDASRPCDGCAARAGCRTPCGLVTALLPPEEIEERHEVHSSVLSEPGKQDGGRDAPFLTLPEAWDDDANNTYGRDAGPDTWRALVARYGGDTLRTAIASPLVLTLPQRAVVEQLLMGRERTEIRTARRTSRQSVHKIVHAAIDRLRKHFGEAPTRAELRETAAEIENADDGLDA